MPILNQRELSCQWRNNDSYFKSPSEPGLLADSRCYRQCRRILLQHSRRGESNGRIYGPA